MPKKPVSVTLEADNLLWLRSRAASEHRRSLSDVIDRIVTEARLGTDTSATMRSVVGTVDIAPDDPDLLSADAYVNDLFGAAVSRPMLVRERPAARPQARSKGRRG